MKTVRGFKRLVYFVQPKSGGLIKIGMTDKGMDRRMDGLRGMNADELVCLGVIVSRPGFTESDIHARFRHLRVRGEWHRPGADLIGFIEGHASEWDASRREFHASHGHANEEYNWCIPSVFLTNEKAWEWFQEENDPDLCFSRAVETFRKLGWDDNYIVARCWEQYQRRELAGLLGRMGLSMDEQEERIRDIHSAVAGRTAYGSMTPTQLAGIRFAEAMAAERIERDNVYGNGACCDVCRQSGAAVHQAMKMMGLAP